MVLRTLVYLSLAVALLGAGCSSSEKKAAEIMEIARFEEKQSNREHAAKLYREVLTKYPDSPQAKEAAKRLEGLGQKP